MRDTVTDITLPTISPTFEVVRHQFETWRKRRRCRSAIPESLWQGAVRLCQEHSIGEVSRTLRVNYRGLKNRVGGARDRISAIGQGSDMNFVKLDLGAPMTPSECLVEMEAPNGAKMTMSFRGTRGDFDLVELSQLFWRQGR
jgi:hypothetical protein